MKIGENVWINVEGKAKEVTIDFLGDGEVAFRLDGKLESRMDHEIYTTKSSAEAHIKGSYMVAFCRETSRTTGEVAVYPIAAEVNDSLIQVLRIRGRYNPELQYGIAMKNVFEKYKDDMVDFDFMSSLADKNKIVRL